MKKLQSARGIKEIDLRLLIFYYRLKVFESASSQVGFLLLHFSYKK